LFVVKKLPSSEKVISDLLNYGDVHVPRMGSFSKTDSFETGMGREIHADIRTRKISRIMRIG
jgi:hypothetical protein